MWLRNVFKVTQTVFSQERNFLGTASCTAHSTTFLCWYGSQRQPTCF